MPPSIDFSRIRAFNQSQNLGFEELCCQLAALEPRAASATFLRKGRGSDQGVECFVTSSDGGQTAWQAKYVTSFEDGQVRNLDDSLDRALSAHPTLHTYTVCLPIDLSDLRGKRKISQLQRYERWRDGRISQAKEAGRQLQIHLWGASQIQERLGRDSPLYSGRLRYWFDEQRLSSAWFATQFEISTANLGERYTPQSHVDLPIQQGLQAVARGEIFLELSQEWGDQLGQYFRNLHSALSDAKFDELRNSLGSTLNALITSLDQDMGALAQDVPLEEWLYVASKGLEIVTGGFAIAESIPKQDRRDAERFMYGVYSALQTIKAEVESPSWQLLNERRLLIVGEAGVGKSHLLADFGTRQLASQKPFVLLLTQTLSENEPWPQILQQLDLADCKASEFVGALDAAAEAHDTRAVVAIDALNERHGLQLWKDRLAGFIKTFEAFPRVSVVLTLRSTYESHLPTQGLPRLVHHGFAGHAGAAAKAYLDARGIVRTSSPNLLREFENPLFLRTCCDYLNMEKLKAIPKGLQGVSSLFEFYLQAISSKVESKLGLDRHRRIPAAAIEAFNEECARAANAGSLSKLDAMDLFERFLPSHGLEARSLFGALVGEGVLTLDMVESDAPSLQETVRFTFERLNDHLVAKRLLDEHLDLESPYASFKREPLKTFVSRAGGWRNAGVVEALAIQLPERCDLELLDVVPTDPLEFHGFVDAFENSLLWRQQSKFTKRTMEWVSELESERGISIYGVLIRVAAEPDNVFNAFELHRRLQSVRMPERDADWSTFLATDDFSEGGPVESLIDWAFEVRPDEVETDRLLLAAVTLTWFLSAPNRAVRDMATKGLAHVLSRGLATAAVLLEMFRDVDDPYVVERLLAACYGASMQGSDLSGLDALSKQVWTQFFGAKPPLDLRSQDYARGILEYTARFGTLPQGIDLGVARGPFDTPWPLEEITDATLAAYRVGGPDGYEDEILSSTGPHGDFGIYSVPSAIHGWSSLPRSFAGKTLEDVFDAWDERFTESATIDQLEAYVEARKAAFAHAKIGWDADWFNDSKRQKRDAAWDHFVETERTFADLLAADQRAEYEDVARYFFLESVRMGSKDISLPDLSSVEVCRWVCWRAHELGWRSELFDSYERSHFIFRERMGSHRIERVGKKYQRIALAEAAARIADHLARDDGGGRIGAYSGRLDELSMLRDIDPSLLVKRSRESSWAYTRKTWWTPTVLELKPAAVPVLLAWLDSTTEGFVNGPENIEVVDPVDCRDWLVLSGFRRWSISRSHQRIHPEAWSRITCLLTRKGNAERLINELLASDRTQNNLLHEQTQCAGFLGEHGWREPAQVKPPLRKNQHDGITVPCMTTIAELTAESGTKDNSILNGFTLDLPSAWLLQAMGLRLRNGRGSEYVDACNVVQFYDPSLHEPGPSAGVVSREQFLKTASAAGLEPIWLIAGEKNVYGANASRPGFGGRVAHLVAYRLENDVLVASTPRVVRSTPSSEQLAALMAEDVLSVSTGRA